MYSKHSIVGIYCETQLHAGSGQAIGAVDLPVQRERTTGWPTIQASGLKGSFRDAYEKYEGANTEAIFGTENSGDQAGAISIGDARILLFPVRSSVAPFLWVTCPAILRKLKRDGRIIGKTYTWTVPEVKDENYLGQGNAQGIIFEDLQLSNNGQVEEEILNTLKPLLPSDDFYNSPNLGDYFCIISDKSFSMLVETATEIHARIQLNENKTSKNLWYQELVPSNTVFYTVVSMMDERKSNDKKKADDLIKSLKDILCEYIQIGGDETLGRGWSRLIWQEVE